MRRIIILTFVCSSICFNAFSQKRVILEPHLLFQYDKGYLISKPNGDHSFHSPIPSLSLYIGFLSEYYFKENRSLLIGFDGTAAQMSFRTTLYGTTSKIIHTHQTEMNFGQLNLGYAQYQKDKMVFSKLFKRSTITLRPKFCVGMGFMQNKPQSEYDSYFKKTFTSIFYGDTLQYSYSTKTDSKFNFSIWVGYYLKLLLKTKEVLSIGLFYNKGFLNQFKTDLNYKLNSNHYSAILGSRATNFNLRIGFPITLKKWK